MGRLILLLGGNQGNIIETFRSVYPKLEEQLGIIVEYSGFYESKPWGFESDQNFINQVVEINYSGSVVDILSITQTVEEGLGRLKKSSSGYSSRLIDIDILFFDEIIFNTPELTIPHPRLHDRMFTLIPLSEKWADYLHPKKNKTIRQLTDECKDTGWVKKI